MTPGMRAYRSMLVIHYGWLTVYSAAAVWATWRQPSVWLAALALVGVATQQLAFWWRTEDTREWYRAKRRKETAA